MVTVVPPAVEPPVGVNEVMVGAATVSKVKLVADVTVPASVVTEILTAAAAWALVTAVISVPLTTV